MARLIERYWDDKLGSRAVDWIVLGAGVVMLSTAVLAATLPETRPLASDQGLPQTIGEA
ncbi:hypothetical protein [Histidinibacterium lentulum]|uniref:hypothetical protein n=1 Tax=Histidinibacterium lentulum TaxID=2480588 RepID=UPI00160965B2|nr:hypothetical protein [Histidinibacterium lentulum]